MEFPDEIALQELGFERVDIDSSMALVRYRKSDASAAVEVDVSFSGVERSFQIVMRCLEREVVVISSEKVVDAKIERDKAGSALQVKFDISGVTAQATVRIEPRIHCHWSVIGSE